MLLLPRGSGKVGRCRVTNRKPAGESQQAFLFVASAASRGNQWVFTSGQQSSPEGCQEGDGVE